MINSALRISIIFLRNSLFLNNQKSTIRPIIDVKRSAINILISKLKGNNNIRIKTIFLKIIV